MILHKAGFKGRFVSANNTLLIGIFIAFLSFAYTWTNHLNKRIGCTELNGDGCVCHNLEKTTDVKVWVNGPLQLETGATGIYRMFLTGGPAMASGDSMAGAYNVASRYGTLAIMDTVSILFWNEITQRIPIKFPSPTDTIFWNFAYTAPDSACTDTIYSTGLSFVLEGLPDTRDYWNFGPKFPVKIIPKTVPVELVSFSLKQEKGVNILSWKTASEINNSGFEILRSEKTGINQSEWETIGFVKGAGTTSEINSYEYADFNNSQNRIAYKLKQIDYNGTFTFSSAIETLVNGTTMGFIVNGAYPNPFNPSTRISFSLGSKSEVVIRLYNLQGETISDIFSGSLDYGIHSIPFDGSGFVSGVYIANIQAGNNSSAIKIILAK